MSINIINWFPQALTFSLILVTLSMGCGPTQVKDQRYSPEIDPLFAADNLVAWCVVPFDSMKRTPRERAAMLHQLGFSKMAYDWREQHLPSFPEEVQALKENQIELVAVWWWIDGQSPNLLNESNEQLLHYLDSLDLKCDIWMSFDERFFEGLDNQQKLKKSLESIRYLHQRASDARCRLQLYNHGSWFGDPHNQVEIIQKSGLADLGIIYNFHHAHQQIDQFEELLEVMMPYLNTVNINGMRKEGPKILAVGAGNQEYNMLKILKNSRFQGHIGIIGHQEDQDVKVVLEENLLGLQSIAHTF